VRAAGLREWFAPATAVQRDRFRAEMFAYVLILRIAWESKSSLYADAISTVIVGHVGEDDFVAFFESIEDFD